MLGINSPRTKEIVKKSNIVINNQTLSFEVLHFSSENEAKTHINNNSIINPELYRFSDQQ